MTTKQKDRIRKVRGLYALGVIVGFVCLIYSNYIFFIGFHNADTCHNIEKINWGYDLSFKEQKISGEIWEVGDCYLSGLGDIIIGFYINMFSALFLGYNFAGLLK